MTILRRFLLFQAFLLWQGGFLFYSAVVVPIGTDFLQSPVLQGMITQRVTHWLNASGFLWALIYFWDMQSVPDPDRRQRLARRIGWAACAILLAVLVWLHREIDAYIDLGNERVTDRPAFRPWHIAYLWVSTAHWVLGMGLVVLTLRAWRTADCTMPPSISPRTDHEQS